VTGTLAGIRIVSTAVNVPGPVAAGMLRDMGATVVKVEPPAGDPLAYAAPAWYAALCADVEVLRLDLKSNAGRGRLDDLLARADVLLTATRPASLQRLGLSWPDLHTRHPGLCHVAVVGHSAPRQDVAGHDLTYQAATGLVTPPALPRTLIADLAGAQRVVIAALDLVLARERSGEAGNAEIALAECASLFAEPLRHRLTSSTGPLGGAGAAYNIYSTRDGWVAVAALEPHFRAALARELSVDVDDRAALARALEERSALEWERWAETRGLPMAAVREQH
jgi:crotonobetainyl-CoA:carnitine CoA-transferase CaiB-like acyl-CoA transferase